MKRYIISFSEDVSTSSEVSDILSRANVVRSERKASKDGLGNQGISDNEFVFLENVEIAIAFLSANEVVALSKSTAVAAIEEDVRVKALGVPQPSPPRIRHTSGPRWNIGLVTADAVWRAGIFGTGVRVAILDTGIASHGNLRTYGGASFVPGVNSYRDDNGHGTHCAGIVAAKGRNNVSGVAPSAELYSVKVLDSIGSGDVSWAIAGMDWSIGAGMNIVSMSLSADVEPMAAFATAVKRCQEKGIVVVCASGNGYGSRFPWVRAPANSFAANSELSSPIAVAAVDEFRLVARFSSRDGNGPDWNLVTISGPGVKVFSTYLDNDYRTLSGTSMACPHVSGLAALILESNRGLGPLAVRALMTTTAEQLGTDPFPNLPYGHGLIDSAFALLVQSLKLAESSILKFRSGVPRSVEKVNSLD